MKHIIGPWTQQLVIPKAAFCFNNDFLLHLLLTPRENPRSLYSPSLPHLCLGPILRTSGLQMEKYAGMLSNPYCRDRKPGHPSVSPPSMTIFPPLSISPGTNARHPIHGQYINKSFYSQLWNSATTFRYLHLKIFPIVLSLKVAKYILCDFWLPLSLVNLRWSCGPEHFQPYIPQIVIYT